jgi:hypothetical protein
VFTLFPRFRHNTVTIAQEDRTTMTTGLRHLAFPLLIVLASLANDVTAQMLHEIEEISTISIPVESSPNAAPREYRVSGSSSCTEKTDRVALESEATWLIDQLGDQAQRVSFICAPDDRMPTDHVVGFTFMSGGMWIGIEVSLHILGTNGQFSDRIVFDHGLCGDPTVLGYLGPVHEPWAFVATNGDCEYTYSAVYDFNRREATILDTWDEFLEESDGVVDLIWIQGNGVHYHHSDPVVVWKTFAGVRDPELIDQQLEWPLVDDRPGNVLRIYRDFEERRARAVRRFPQPIP